MYDVFNSQTTMVPENIKYILFLMTLSVIKESVFFLRNKKLCFFSYLLKTL